VNKFFLFRKNLYILPINYQPRIAEILTVIGLFTLNRKKSVIVSENKRYFNYTSITVLCEWN